MFHTTKVVPFSSTLFSVGSTDADEYLNPLGSRSSTFIALRLTSPVLVISILKSMLLPGAPNSGIGVSFTCNPDLYEANSNESSSVTLHPSGDQPVTAALLNRVPYFWPSIFATMRTVVELPGNRFPRLFHFMVLPISDPAGVLEMKVNPSGMISVSSSLKGTSPVFETLMAKSVIVPGEPEDGDTASDSSTPDLRAWTFVLVVLAT